MQIGADVVDSGAKRGAKAVNAGERLVGAECEVWYYIRDLQRIVRAPAVG